MWCHLPVPPQEPAAAQLPSPAPAPLVIYSSFLKLFWESVKTEPGAGASPLEAFCSRQDSALDHSFGTGWWQEQRGTSVPGCCTVGKAETNLCFSSPARPWQTAGRHWVVGKAAGPREKEGLGHHHGLGGGSVKCRQGLTLPLGPLHAEASPQDSCHPCMSLGCALGHTFTFLCFSVTFLRAFAIVWRCCRALHGWETAALDGEAPFPKKKGLFFGFAAGFDVVELTAVSPVPSPSVFESSGAPELSPLLDLSFVCFSWL